MYFILKKSINIMILLILVSFFTLGCDKLDSKKNRPDKKNVTSKTKKPDGVTISKETSITQLTTDKSAVEIAGFVNLSLQIEIGIEQKYHIFWKSTCGMVSPDPSGLKAIFIAPNSPQICNITATIKDSDMKLLAKREIAIEVESTLIPEVENEL
jgi:uncharacterized protein YcfL